MRDTYIRLRCAAEELKGIKTAAALARILNESEQNINNWSRRGVPNSKLVLIESLIGVAPSWISTGLGLMTHRNDFIKKTYTPKTPEGTKAARIIDQMHQDQRDHTLQIINTFSGLETRLEYKFRRKESA